MLTSLFAAGSRRDRTWPLDGLPQSTYAPSRATSQRSRSCAAWTLICTVTVLLAAATMGVNILHPGAGLGQQLALSGKNRALAEVDADGDLAAIEHEADYHNDPALMQQPVAGAVNGADAAATDSADGSPELGDSEDAEVEPPVEEEPSGRERSATVTKAAAAEDADDEDDLVALENAATGGMAEEDDSEQPPADEDETEQPQPSAADAEVTEAAQDATSAEGLDGGAAEPNDEGTDSSNSVDSAADSEPISGEQAQEEDQDELLEPLSDSSAADAVPQAETEQPEAVADGASDADAGSAADEPSGGSAAVVETGGDTAMTAAEDAAVDGSQSAEASSASDEEAAAPVQSVGSVPPWRRAHDSTAADTGEEASAGDTPGGLNAVKWPTEDSAAAEIELVIDYRGLEAKQEPTDVEESAADTSVAVSPQTGDDTIGQSTLADQQSVNERAEEQDVSQQAGEQGAVEGGKSTQGEEEVVDRGGIDAAEAAAAGGSDESARADNEQDSNGVLVSASHAGGASEAAGSF